MMALGRRDTVGGRVRGGGCPAKALAVLVSDCGCPTQVLAVLSDCGCPTKVLTVLSGCPTKVLTVLSDCGCPTAAVRRRF